MNIIIQDENGFILDSYEFDYAPKIGDIYRKLSGGPVYEVIFVNSIDNNCFVTVRDKGKCPLN